MSSAGTTTAPRPDGAGSGSRAPSRLAQALRDPWVLIGFSAIGGALVFVVWPLLELLRQSFIGQDSGTLGFENYQIFFGSNYFTRALWNSLVVASGATVLALAIGVPLAYAFKRYVFPGKGLLRVGVLLSMMSPPFIGAYAWIVLFGRAGIVTQWAQGFGIDLPTIYGPGGIILASALSLYPIVFLVVGSALERIDTSLEEAAASLGRPPAAVVWSVTLPLLRPAIVTSAMLVFLGVIADFGLPNILGEGERYPVLATLAYNLYLSEIGAEPGMAATTSVLLVVLAFSVVLVGRWLSLRLTVASDGSATPPARALPRGTALVVAGATLFTVLLANLPLAVVVISSFLEVRGAVFQPAFSLDNYSNAFNLIGNALWNSLMYASIALVLATIAGAALGYLIGRRRTPWVSFLDLLVMIPFVVPGTVLGIGYAQVFNAPPLMLTGTASIIVIIYFVRRLPYIVRSSGSVVQQIDVSMEEASTSLGEPPLRGFRKVMLPLMKPGILAGVAIAWLEIFNELSASIVLYTGATRTLPIAAYQQAFGGDFGIAAAYSTMLIVITAITLGAALKLGGPDKMLTPR
jgi:iron(III) transport system permease protein